MTVAQCADSRRGEGSDVIPDGKVRAVLEKVGVRALIQYS